MKESLFLSYPLRQLILEGYEEKSMKYMTQIKRKGTLPEWGSKIWGIIDEDQAPWSENNP